ncbi:MAG: hypothetical protein ACRD2E_03035 [Terriglobales bacterium]
MTAATVLAEAEAAGIELRLTDRGLVARGHGPKEAAAPLLARIRAVKAQVVAALANAHHFGPLPADPEAAESERRLRAQLREPEYARALAAGGGTFTARAAALAAAPRELTTGRRLTFAAAAGQPVPGEWRSSPHGPVEIVAWGRSGVEALGRRLPEPHSWHWIAAGDLSPVPFADGAPEGKASAPGGWREGTLCPGCCALRWLDRDGRRRCDCPRPAPRPAERGRLPAMRAMVRARGAYSGPCPCGGDHGPCAITGRCGLECECSLCQGWRKPPGRIQ